MNGAGSVKRYGVLAVVAAVVIGTGVATLGFYRTNYTGLVVSPDLEVVRVLGDAPSAASGIEPGDRLVSFDGRRLGSLSDYIAAHRDPGVAGREVPVEVERGGETRSFPLEVGAYPLLHSSLFGPISGVVLLAFGIYVFVRKPGERASTLYLGITTCLFVLLALRCHPGYLALHSP